MPCYEVNLMTVAWGHVNVSLLKVAAESIGGTVSIGETIVSIYGFGEKVYLDKDTGVASLEGRAFPFLNKVKKAYSKEVVKAAAKKHGWSGAWKADKAVYVKF